jgi:hypothetical protein
LSNRGSAFILFSALATTASTANRSGKPLAGQAHRTRPPSSNAQSQPETTATNPVREPFDGLQIISLPESQDAFLIPHSLSRRAQGCVFDQRHSGSPPPFACRFPALGPQNTCSNWDSGGLAAWAVWAPSSFLSLY